MAVMEAEAPADEPFTPRLYVDAIAGFVRAHDPR